MKHSDTAQPRTPRRRPSPWAAALMWGLPLLLIIPNAVLDCTEVAYTMLDRIVNLALPAGVYLLLLAAFRRQGITALCLVPVMVLCAFQIVLLFLYGESIIAIDMFLNVATTNPGEAGELLANLVGAILVVCALYLPPIALAVVLTVKGAGASKASRLAAAVAGLALTAVGVACIVAVGLRGEAYRADRRLFPVNVISNLCEAVHRTERTEAFFRASAAFEHHAVDTRPDSAAEVYVLVIGETSRAGNWQLNGYDRPTNPRLSRREGLVSCPRVLSESNTTHKSVPLMMSHLDADRFADSIYCSKSVIEAFNEAGYATAWLSNQQRNGALIDFYGDEASEVCFLKDRGKQHFDSELCPLLADFLRRNAGRKVFAVLHTYGSHFNYRDRYPADGERFRPCGSMEAEADNRPSLINAYDNTILYTDAVLDSIIAAVEADGRRAAVLYVADHGEDIFDDSRGRFLHASPTPTYWQLHVPMVMWMSEGYRCAYPDRYAALRANAARNVSSSRSVFHTLLSAAGVAAPCLRPDAALTSASYTEPRRVFLNDYDEAVPLASSGLRSPDIAALAARRIF